MSRITIQCPHCNVTNRLESESLATMPKCVHCKIPLLEGKPIEGSIVNLGALIDCKNFTLVEFWAPYCNACNNFEPVFEAVSLQHPAVTFIKVDIQKQKIIGQQYNIRTIPTLMLFKNGEVVDTLNDALPQTQFKQWLAEGLLK